MMDNHEFCNGQEVRILNTAFKSERRKHLRHLRGMTGVVTRYEPYFNIPYCIVQAAQETVEVYPGEIEALTPR